MCRVKIWLPQVNFGSGLEICHINHEDKDTKLLRKYAKRKGNITKRKINFLLVMFKDFYKL